MTYSLKSVRDPVTWSADPFALCTPLNACMDSVNLHVAVSCLKIFYFEHLAHGAVVGYGCQTGLNRLILVLTRSAVTLEHNVKAVGQMILYKIL